MINHDAFTKAIKRDDKYKRFIKMVKRGAYNLDTESMLTQISSMHSTGKIRKLKHKDVVEHEQKQLIEAVLTNYSYFARTAEIKRQCSEVKLSLQGYMEDLSKYLKVTYYNQMKEKYKTVASQKEAVLSAFDIVVKKIRELDIVIKSCDILLEDLDKGYFTAHLVSNILKVNATPEARRTM